MINPIKLAISPKRVGRPKPIQKAPTADKIKINKVLRGEKPASIILWCKCLRSGAIGERPESSLRITLLIMSVAGMAMVQRHSVAGMFGLPSNLVVSWLAPIKAVPIIRPTSIDPLSPKKIFLPLKTCKLNSKNPAKAPENRTAKVA